MVWCGHVAGSIWFCVGGHVAGSVVHERLVSNTEKPFSLNGTWRMAINVIGDAIISFYFVHDCLSL